MPAVFEIKKAKDGQFYFNLKAANGQVVLTSEMYRAKRGARNGIASVQKNAATAERFEKKTNKRGKAFFVLKAANHQVIGQSEAYESETACAAGIASVTQSAKAAGVTDLTA